MDGLDVGRNTHGHRGLVWIGSVSSGLGWIGSSKIDPDPTLSQRAKMASYG